MATMSRLHLLIPSRTHSSSSYSSLIVSSSSPFPNSHSHSRLRHFSNHRSRWTFTAAPPPPPPPPRFFCSRSDRTAEASDGAPEGPSIVGDLLDYLNESWTQFHATAEAKRQLLAAGFHLLKENDDWDLKPGGRYFFTRNMSSLIAFAIGEKYSVGNGFHAIAAHTDSPCLKLKPNSASSKAGYLMLNVQTYGAGLWHTWFDRDLSLAGRVIVRAADGSFLHKLVKLKKPLLRVPTLAIHLDRSVSSFTEPAS